MIWIAIILAVAALIVLEKLWMPAALNALKYRGECDRLMAEPGEIITWYGTVENHSRLPVPFVRLIQNFPTDTVLHAKERWIQGHYKKSVYQWYVEERFSLRPWQSVTRSVAFSLPRRGIYPIGEHRISAGDLLGVQEGTKMGEGKVLVIIPERAKNYRAMEAFGGFLGDVSVRRFILEDPILTVGFRDYTGHEPIKAVSWTRTATAGKLQVKQFDHTSEQTVTVLLDVDGASYRGLEACFRLTRSVCEELERRKIPYGFRTNGNLNSPVGKIFSLADGLGGQHLDTILYALGRADNTCYRSLRSLAQQALRQRKLNEAYILITSEPSADTLEVIKMLENGSGNPACVLYGSEEVGE